MDMPDFTIEKEEKAKRKNVGKDFEKDFKNSIPDNVFYYRFKDSSGAWQQTEITRFTTSNIADCLLFNGTKLYILELKTVKGKSFSFKNVRGNQLKEMLKASKFTGIVAGFVINFRDVEKTVFIEVNEFYDIMNRCGKKSFNLQDLEFHHYTDIKRKKLKVHYRYDLSALIAPF